MKESGPLFRRFAFAAGVVIAATLVRFMLSSWLGDSTPYLLFFPAIMAASWYGGWGPGLFATLLSAAAAFIWFVKPFQPFSLDSVADDASLLLFLAVGAFIARVNQHLRESFIVGGQLAAIVECSDDAIVSKDLNGIIKSWNRAAERLFGYTAAEVIGKSITIIIPAERLPEEERVLARIRTGQRVDPLETRRQRKDGTLVDVSITVSPIKNASGRIVGASKIARDIGDRLRMHHVQQQLLLREREATAEAIESRDRLQFLAEVGELLTSSLDYQATLDRAVHVALPRLGDYCTVIVRDEQGITHLVAWGHAIREKEAALRELANRLIASAPARNVSTFADEVMRTGKTLIVTHERLEAMMVSITDMEPDIVHLGRILRPYAYVGAPLSARGRTVGVMAFGRTEQESHHDYSPAEIALIEDFARRVSLAIENARLFRKADELNRLKDEFLATISHELRTPLSAILGWLRMLVSGQLEPDKAKRAMEAVERNAQAQAKLVDDILDVARGMAGNVRLEMKTIDLGAVAHRSVDAIAPTASAKKIHVQVSAPAPVSVVGDPNRLQQVIWNLVSNAVKFTPSGGHVRVRICSVDGNAELEVTDTGEGIPPGFLPHVFDKFRQADASFTRQHGGLGLGLAIARHLVELHGGSVEAKSEGEGKGATFVVRLPLAELN